MQKKYGRASTFFPSTKRRLRDTVRHFTLSALALFSGRRTKKSLRANRVQNLYFHFLPESDSENFISLIRTLGRDHTFISYSEAMERIQSGAIDRPYLSISFDDGFESNIRAAEILAAEGISACFFVCPEMVGKDRAYLKEEFSGDIGDEERMMQWGELEKLVSMGHEIGSHTMDHSVLSGLSFGDAYNQIVDSKKALDSKFGDVKHFAWPRGRFHHFGADLVNVVFNAGYDTCASAERGAHLQKLPQPHGGVRRENCVASWPISHTLYLMGRSVRKKSSRSGEWPSEWNVNV